MGETFFEESEWLTVIPIVSRPDLEDQLRGYDGAHYSPRMIQLGPGAIELADYFRTYAQGSVDTLLRTGYVEVLTIAVAVEADASTHNFVVFKGLKTDFELEATLDELFGLVNMGLETVGARYRLGEG